MLTYLTSQFSPEDLLHFVELDEFRDDWESLGLDVESDLWALQIMIMAGPKKSPVVQGTGGLRKIRFSPDQWHKGKSGGVRVCYVYFEKHWTVLLVAAYDKNEKDNLTAEEKRGIRDYIRSIERYLSERSYT
jgi:hypothetical protein